MDLYSKMMGGGGGGGVVGEVGEHCTCWGGIVYFVAGVLIHHILGVQILNVGGVNAYFGGTNI